MNLARAVRANTYKPRPLRVRRIPKKDRRRYRTLRIPTVTDRVLQRGILQVLQPVYEARFLDCSFGYRPGRGLLDAVIRIVILREQGLGWVLDADIDDFFNNVNQALLVKFLEDDLPEGSLIPLIAQFLEFAAGKYGDPVGIPMGSPLSPLLANVFLHRLDCKICRRGRHLVRYADDFVVLTASESAAQKARAEIGEWLAELELEYKPSKTCVTSFEAGFEFLGVRFDQDSYSYTWEDKEIEVEGNEVDWLFSRYGPEYE